MAWIRTFVTSVCVASVGCTAGTGDDTTGLVTTTTTGNTDPTATTIPLPTTDDQGSGTTATPTEDSSGSGSATTAATDGSDSGTTGEADSSSGEPETSEDTRSTIEYDVSWCRLQFPPAVDVAVDEVFTVYVRLFAEGLTDQSSSNDLAPELMVEMGYGPDGSNPSMGDAASWTWVAGMGNPGWDDAKEPNNDEYWGDLAIGAAGVYDYASRISGDGGGSWVYCDLDDLLTGGYTPDMAGQAEVGL
ncbi:MAG: hypothetical protein AAF799_43215 [Myxococcota bacterium]